MSWLDCLLRVIFPDPDMLFRFLESDQQTAITWFLDWFLISLEGVEFHLVVKEGAQTRAEMIYFLRFRDAHERLCLDPPVYVRL